MSLSQRMFEALDLLGNGIWHDVISCYGNSQCKTMIQATETSFVFMLCAQLHVD